MEIVIPSPYSESYDSLSCNVQLFVKMNVCASVVLIGHGSMWRCHHKNVLCCRCMACPISE